MRHYFIKEGEAPVWIRVPGTPFTMLGSPTKHERLPGMTEWAPRPVVERMSKGLQQKIDPETLVQREEEEGLPWDAAKGGIGGLTAGALAGRLAGGEATTAPLRELLAKGVSKETLKGLKNVPRAAKILPLAGAGAGALGGAAYWSAGKPARREQAEEVAKGLLSEKILQQHSINQARQSVSALKGLPVETARAESPVVVTPGNTGV
jgi:hypothetical protein